MIAALKFAEGTSSEPTLPVAQVYKVPQKKTKIMNELIEKCYHWMTHVISIHSLILNEIKTKRYQNQIYIVPMDIMNFILGTYGVTYIDKRTNKAHKFDIQQYAHHCQFLDKRKIASHPFIFVPICNGGHWWL
ncbi:hypothetical protein Ahy_A04g018114 [Arachis hypogaea]|uniref:Ubiquitin-like protease family profile domain-containing protein n=1 Tax=Arachis hypogaea TaxID=3818 RepID=A0A445DCW9_ARAHY|nr:hypothetical protein Ahy_A04g018114 [Arachis hypogaea]